MCLLEWRAKWMIVRLCACIATALLPLRDRYFFMLSVLSSLMCVLGRAARFALTGQPRLTGLSPHQWPGDIGEAGAGCKSCLMAFVCKREGETQIYSCIDFTRSNVDNHLAMKSNHITTLVDSKENEVNRRRKKNRHTHPSRL